MAVTNTKSQLVDPMTLAKPPREFRRHSNDTGIEE